MMTVADPDLSPAMRAELVTAARCEIEGLCVVVCHQGTRKALVRRGLAEEQHIYRAAGRRTVLTREGRHAAARVVDEDNPVLKPGSVVTYHGARQVARGRRLIVVAVAGGTYAVCSDDPAGTVRLGQVRRESLHFTGELVNLAAEEVSA